MSRKKNLIIFIVLSSTIVFMIIITAYKNFYIASKQYHISIVKDSAYVYDNNRFIAVTRMDMGGIDSVILADNN